MYGSLFSLESKAETGTHYLGLHMVEEFSDVFPDEFSRLHQIER